MTGKIGTAGLCLLVLAGCGRDGDGAVLVTGAEARAAAAVPGVHGDFGCTQSAYDASSGAYDTLPKGTLEIDGSGGYAYSGFDATSRGRIRDDGDGTLVFAGGHLDGGEAVADPQRRGLYTITAPAIGDRWTCRRTDG